MNTYLGYINNIFALCLLLELLDFVIQWKAKFRFRVFAYGAGNRYVMLASEAIRTPATLTQNLTWQYYEIIHTIYSLLIITKMSPNETSSIRMGHLEVPQFSPKWAYRKVIIYVSILPWNIPEKIITSCARRDIIFHSTHIFPDTSTLDTWGFWIVYSTFLNGLYVSNSF